MNLRGKECDVCTIQAIQTSHKQLEEVDFANKVAGWLRIGIKIYAQGASSNLGSKTESDKTLDICPSCLNNMKKHAREKEDSNPFEIIQKAMLNYFEEFVRGD